MPANLPRKIDEYVIDMEIGRGGMKRVLRGWNEYSPDDYVAVAIMLQQFPSDQEAKRFLRERESLKNLSHPNIVRMIGDGVFHQQPYFVMEYLDGGTVSGLIDERALSPAHAVKLISQACDGISYANERGILHRDIKPENMVLDSKRVLKMADFGLAKNREDEEKLTTLGQSLGTRWYVSPEMLAADHPRVGAPSEVFSMAVSLIEMLLGRRAFLEVMNLAGPSYGFQPERYAAALSHPCFPNELVEICRHATLTDPSDRYQSIVDFKSALLDVYSDEQQQIAEQRDLFALESSDMQGLDELMAPAVSTLDNAMDAAAISTGPVVQGQTLNERYELTNLLGSSEMGEVWKADDLECPGRAVVVKLLPLRLRHDQKATDGLLQNFQLVGDLHHDNICPIKDISSDPIVGRFVVMQYIEGRNLDQVIQRRRASREHFELIEVVRTLHGIANALDKIHLELGLTHRDIKPANLMVSESGKTWLIDFGLAKTSQNSVTQSRIDHGPSGTPFYMSPEAWRSEPIGPQADQYSLAVVAYELLAGEVPFRNAPILSEAVCNTLPPSITTLDAAVNRVLARALSKQPANRYESCIEFVEALRRCGDEQRPLSNRSAGMPIERKVQVGVIALALAGIAAFTVLDRYPGQPSIAKVIPDSGPSDIQLESDRDSPIHDSNQLDLNPEDSLDSDPTGTIDGRMEPTVAEKSDPAAAAFDSGIALMEEGKNEAAITQFSRAIELDGKLVEAYIKRGVAKMRLRRNQDAVDDFDSALKQDSENLSALLHRAGALRNAGQLVESINTYSTLISLAPSSAEAYYGRGIAWCDHDSPSEGISDFGEAIALDSNFADAWERRGRAFVIEERYTDAIRDFQQAMKLFPARLYLSNAIVECERNAAKE